jgi:hypothetical protein
LALEILTLILWNKWLSGTYTFLLIIVIVAPLLKLGRSCTIVSASS